MDAVGGGGGGASSSLTEAFEDIFPYAAPVFSISLVRILPTAAFCLAFVGGGEGTLLASQIFRLFKTHRKTCANGKTGRSFLAIHAVRPFSFESMGYNHIKKTVFARQNSHQAKNKNILCSMTCGGN